MNVSDHTTRVFDSDLIKLTQLVAQMGGFAQKQVTDAIEYLHKENPGSITDETDEVTTDNHLADVATVTYDRELDYTLEENSEELLRAIDDALLRINDGTYGICENRGEKISAERLEAVPWTRLCIDCKRLEER